MKKLLLTLSFVVTFFALMAVSASAVVNDIVKVGLRFGDSAMFSANLENAVGEGYEFGWFDGERRFNALGWTEEIAISMTAAGDIYMYESGAYSAGEPDAAYEFLGAWHVEIDGFDSFEDAQDAARDYGGWPAWIDDAYVVRVGSYGSRSAAEDAAAELGEGSAVRSSDTGVLVSVTRTTEIIFEFDCGGTLDLGVRPMGGETSTWFRGYKYPGGFEYPRTAGGNLGVRNIVDLESYVKGVIPYEMDDDWPLAALEAQAVCARTYACRTTTHVGFDVCSGVCCQVYYGHGSGGAGASAITDQAVENTAGEKLYYDGYLVQDAVYHSFNGGATEDAENVWGTAKGYLVGKQDPYESQIDIPNYSWTTTYTAAELTWILEQKDYTVGTVENVYISEYTPVGNVAKITFEGSRGSVTVSGDVCRTIFYSSTYGKSAKSMRFTINGGDPAGGTKSVYINGGGTALTSLDGLSVLSGGDTMGTLKGDSFTVLSAAGTSRVELGGGAPTASRDGTFTLSGTGSGHNVGMSQYGARAMAELGYTYDEILKFYYTDVTIE